MKGVGGGGEEEEVNRRRGGNYNNVKEWTRLEFANSQRAVENRKKWRELFAKVVSAAPNDPYTAYGKAISEV